VPFVICRAGNDEVAKKSKAIAMAFGVPYMLTVTKPVQRAKGTEPSGGLSSYAAARTTNSADSSRSRRSWKNAGEAVSLWLMELECDETCGMIDDAKFESHLANKTNSKAKPEKDSAQRRGDN